MIKQTREQWLLEASETLVEVLDLNIDPDQYNVSVIPPKTKGKVLGVCYARSQSKVGKNEIFISAHISEPRKALGTLAHELIHAVDDCQSGHGGQFKQLAQRVGFDAPLTTYNPSPSLVALLDDVLESLPPYPIEEMIAPAPRDRNRNIKVECKGTDYNGEPCDFRFNASRKTLARIDADSPCPVCHSEGLFVAFPEGAGGPAVPLL